MEQFGKGVNEFDIFNTTMSNLVKVNLLASSSAENLEALALSPVQIEEKLRIVPVFTLVDANNLPLVAIVPNQGNSSTRVAGAFISQQDAQTFLDQLKTRNPQLAALVQVISVSLEEIYQLNQVNKGKPNEVQFAFVPAQQQVELAKTVQRQNGQQVNEFNGVPLFVARGGPENGYLTIPQAQKEVIPLFFNLEELQGLVERFKQEQPNLAGSIKFEVVRLEDVLSALPTDSDPFFEQIALVPTQESIDFVRSLSGIITDFDQLSFFNKLLTTSANARFLDLTPGNDLFQISPGTAAQFSGGVRAFEGNDSVSGSSDDDVINGNAGNDVLRGGAGSDVLRGGKGSDLIFGDDDNDILSGGQDNDSLDGGSGNDFLRGGRGNESLNGGEGNDFLLGDAGFDILTGGGGTDTFTIKTDVDAGVRDVNFADLITDFNQGDKIAIAGSISLNDLSFNAAGVNTLILLANGDILANVLNAAPTTVSSATFTALTTDSALNLG